MRRPQAILTIATVALTIAAFIFTDFQPVIDFIASLTHSNLSNPSTSIAWITLFFRVSVFLLLILFVIICDIVLYRRKLLWYHAKSRYTCDGIVSYLKGCDGKISTITVFGYSLTFAESLRIYLKSTTSRDLCLNVITPYPKYLEKHCIEDKPMEYRVNQLRGRILEWLLLENANHAKQVNIYHFWGPPNENGVVIDDRIIFIGRYPWKCEGGKLALHKNPINERKMIKIDDADDLIFKYLIQMLDSRQLDRVNYLYDKIRS